MGLEEKLPEGVLTTSLEGLINWGRQNSTWPLLFGLACCAIEMIAVGTSRHDIRSCQQQDGSCHQAYLRPDVRTQMGHRHGHLRQCRWTF